MPRRFSETEERQIDAQLREAARELMGRRGVRKTSIDDLASHAGISKGSFYRFYPSKEVLALELLAEWELAFHEGITRRFRSENPHGVDATARVLRSVMLEDFPRVTAETGMQGLFDPQEIQYLQQRAHPEHLERMDTQDFRLFERLKPLFFRAGLEPVERDSVIIAGLRLCFDAALGVLGAHSEGPLAYEDYYTACECMLAGFIGAVFREREEKL
ncbi:MAG: TetR/AcrR family transcriptional regulator [Spirochaeta sp.]